MLEADTTRAALINEEAALTHQFEEQEQLLLAGAAAADPSAATASTTAADASLSAPSSSAVACWDEATWASKLARYAQLGAELESGGADACEAKVRHCFYSKLVLLQAHTSFYSNKTLIYCYCTFINKP